MLKNKLVQKRRQPEKSEAIALGAKLKYHWKEGLIKAGLFLCAFLSVVTTIAIITVLAREAFPFFREVPFLDFVAGTKWTPLLQPRSFGVLPLVCGTLLIVAGAALVALPIGLASAIYLGEYASRRVRSIIKPVLEILAGIPTVVYGYFALTFVTPLLATFFPSTQVFNAASASIVVGIMVLPMVASLCDDALRAVPDSLRQGAYALGATQFEVTTRVVLPASLSGVVASFVLAASRAIGETMAVTLAAGATPKMTLNPLESIQTMTAYIVQVSLGDAPAGTVEYKTIFAVAALLFAITLGMNIVAHKVLRQFQEVYE
ncbi:MAG: phosphate ABC transporter permease subunit PstC [Actinobacteria bacterium]|nr:phosphate ABC transporter permease subunit PstC [Actinomycetota bacterium]